jgi:phosphohistidine phosphatase SixA
MASFITSSLKIELKLKILNTVSHQPQVENITTELNGIWQPPKIS